MTYRGYDEARYLELRAEIDELRSQWFNCTDEEEATRLREAYFAAVHAASEIAPPVARVWDLAKELEAAIEMEELK